MSKQVLPTTTQTSESWQYEMWMALHTACDGVMAVPALIAIIDSAENGDASKQLQLLESAKSEDRTAACKAFKQCD